MHPVNVSPPSLIFLLFHFTLIWNECSTFLSLIAKEERAHKLSNLESKKKLLCSCMAGWIYLFITLTLITLKCNSSIFTSQNILHFNSKMYICGCTRLNAAARSRAADKSRKRLQAAEKFTAALQPHKPLAAADQKCLTC